MVSNNSSVTLDRRAFVSRAAVSTLAFHTVANLAAGANSKIRAVAFDGFPILDSRPVFALVNELYPGKGPELSSLWRTRQFEYTWLRTLSRRYSDFRHVTEDALVFATKVLNVPLTPQKRARLMDAYHNLRCWPDVPAGLDSLKKANIRIALLSNLTANMLEAGIRNSGLAGQFDFVLSTDRVQTYKPDPRAYQMGVDAFQLKVSEILYVAFAGWDAVGARSFGYPTFWLNRQSQPAEELGVSPDAIGGDFDQLVRFAVT